MNREIMLRLAILRAVFNKCGWVGWRAARWLESECVTDNCTMICPPLHDAILQEFRKLAARA
jgi:hypothetical protein